MHSVLDAFYKDCDRPAGFTPSHFVQEFLLSYKLLFAGPPGARRLWRDKERMKASDAAGGFCDPMLEKALRVKRKNPPGRSA